MNPRHESPTLPAATGSLDIMETDHPLLNDRQAQIMTLETFLGGRRRRPEPSPSPPTEVNTEEASAITIEGVGEKFPRRKRKSSPRAYGFTAMLEAREALRPRVLSLKDYCIKGITNNIELFEGFGEIKYELYEPILHEVGPETLLRFEQNTMDLASRTEPLWQRLFEETYPVEYNDIERGNRTLPECWRTVFWSIEEERRIRLLDIEQRIRGTRAEIETHKRENAIKVTAPLTKRHRPNSWGSNVAWGAPRPKTLFEKARFESKKIQKTVFGPNMTSKFSSSKAAAAVMRPAATLGMLTSGSGSGFISGKISTTESISFANPAKLKGLSSVVVKAMQQSRSQPSSSSTASPGPSSSSSTGKMTLAPSAPIAVASGLVRTYPPSQASSVSSMSPPSMSPPPSLPPKKDPLAALFMPKHKAFSQKPVAPPRQTKPIPSGTTKHNTTPIKGGTATTTPSTSPSKSQAAAASSNPPGPASTPPRATTTTTLMLPGRYTGQSPVPLPTFSGVGQSKNTVSPIHRR